MEKGFESWFQNQQIDWQSPNPNSSSAPIGLGPRVTIPSMVSPKASVRQEPCGWFYGLPRYRQGFIPAVNSKLPVASPNDVGAAEKKFLVFDQSGDQTMLIYSSGVGIAPIRHHFPPSDNPKLQSGSHPLHVDECIKENDGDDSRSEMREDTEELNALLYSDDDDNDDDDENEEMSTGHSPGSVTGFVEQKRKNCEEEEAESSFGPTKRCKREEGVNIVNSLEDTASSGKSGINCLGNGGNGEFEEESNDFSAGNRRVRKEKLKETLSLLQNLIPGGKNDRNAIVVIDEAIHYLRSLKVKAKSLGLDSL
ncbi:transcription factor bHLH145-like [Cynara cardunculus var. scolymus]|uniref:transcription factor bHLH145-like n=1 Tax=Cynara cardunculus var. scolymus TaxID=59895 RepID=UPI000D629206|nr:transcription factor bHLH145-like [Cynara cardunculus var. scolymus]XP_024976109.1 transcription factor bHLH145-like [Cynara cardunculus var. scolymus]XP_024976110.1 transcription factor bHLH145-like [Cynara cardunculus var. scolymus]